jgi:undecaprenyl-diphosphatase
MSDQQIGATGTSDASDDAAAPEGCAADVSAASHAVLRLVGWGAALAIVLCGIGLVLVHVLTPSALTLWEDGVEAGVVERRTPTLDLASSVGSRMSDTITCIVVLAVMMLVLRWWLGRWRESLALAAAIVGELLVFLVVTFVVQRDRPDVPRLDAAPPTSSFPSGHTAAAVAIYGCLAVVIWRNMSRRRWALVLVVLLATIPVAVGLSRIYRGMHHPSDVLLGAMGGGIWLLVVVSVLLPRGAPAAVDVATAPGELDEEPRRDAVPT